MSLKSQTISGVLWGSVGKVGILLVQFVLLIILGRILSPYVVLNIARIIFEFLSLLF